MKHRSGIFCKSLKFLLLGLAVGLMIPSTQARDSVDNFTLYPGIPVVISADEDPALFNAVSHLKRDLQSVFGKVSPIYFSMSELGNNPGIIVLGPNSEFTGFENRQPEGREAHRVSIKTDGERSLLVLHGADVRGTIYSVYTASEKILGIPPLWFWASLEPEPKTSIEIPVDIDLNFETPFVQFRAWYPNDQTRHGPWREIASENPDALIEAMLRLKLNTIVMDYIIEGHHRLSRTARLGHEHGMILANTHISPLGTRIIRNWENYWRANRPDEEAPGLLLENIDLLFEMWDDNIRFLKAEGVEIVWTLAFRGDPDRPFWNLFADAPQSDAERGAIIQENLRAQVDLLRKHFPDQPVYMRTVLYNEVSDLFAAGHLELPDDPDLIWNFVAARRDHFPPDGIRDTNFGDRKLGYYMNFQFTSTGSHFAQAEGPWKMENNFRMINQLSSPPLSFGEVNMGNIREHVLEGTAFSEMMWKWNDFSANRFVREFFRQYFGEKLEPEITALYTDFISGYWQQRKPTIRDFDRQFIFQDLRYLRLITRILDAGPGNRNPVPVDHWFEINPGDNNARDTLGAIINGTTRADSIWSKSDEKADQIHLKLSSEKQPFFNDLLRTQIRFMYSINKTALRLAISSDLSSRNPRRSEEARRSAQEAFTQALSMLEEQDHGRFRDWNKNIRPSFHQRIVERIKRALE